MERKYFGLSILAFFLCLFCYYSFIYFGNHKKIDTSNRVEITDLHEVSAQYQSAVDNIGHIFLLDSNGKFNPKGALTRMETMKILDTILLQVDKSYRSVDTSQSPYYKDFDLRDEDKDTILRISNYIDSKSNFIKHFEIFGYELNKNNAITYEEFLVLLSCAVGEQSTGLSGNNLDPKFAPYIYKLEDYGIDISLMDGKAYITREIAAYCIFKLFYA